MTTPYPYNPVLDTPYMSVQDVLKEAAEFHNLHTASSDEEETRNTEAAKALMIRVSKADKLTQRELASLAEVISYFLELSEFDKEREKVK